MLRVTLAACLLLTLSCCGREEGASAPIPPGEGAKAADGPAEALREALRRLRERTTGRMERYSMSDEQARDAGLTEAEARFEGSWNHFDWGIVLRADKTFTLWTRDERPLSKGRWGVGDDKLRLTHLEFKKVALLAPVVTEHALAELESTGTVGHQTPQEQMEALKKLQEEMQEAMREEEAGK